MVMKNPPRANFLRISGEDKAGFSGERSALNDRYTPQIQNIFGLIRLRESDCTGAV